MFDVMALVILEFKIYGSMATVENNKNQSEFSLLSLGSQSFVLSLSLCSISSSLTHIHTSFIKLGDHECILLVKFLV